MPLSRNTYRKSIPATTHRFAENGASNVKVDNQTTRNARGEISQAQARKLLEAAEAYLGEQFSSTSLSYNSDHEIRILLKAIIREIRGE
jgi:hypothetical protein